MYARRRWWGAASINSWEFTAPSHQPPIPPHSNLHLAPNKKHAKHQLDATAAPEQLARLRDTKDELLRGVARSLQGKVNTPVPSFILSSMHANCPAPLGFVRGSQPFRRILKKDGEADEERAAKARDREVFAKLGDFWQHLVYRRASAVWEDPQRMPGGAPRRRLQDGLDPVEVFRTWFDRELLQLTREINERYKTSFHPEQVLLILLFVRERHRATHADLAEATNIPDLLGGVVGFWDMTRIVQSSCVTLRQRPSRPVIFHSLSATPSDPFPNELPENCACGKERASQHILESCPLLRDARMDLLPPDTPMQLPDVSQSRTSPTIKPGLCFGNKRTPDLIKFLRRTGLGFVRYVKDGLQQLIRRLMI